MTNFKKFLTTRIPVHDVVIQISVEDRILMYSGVKNLSRPFVDSDEAPFPPEVFSLDNSDQLERQNCFVIVSPVVVQAGFN